MNLMKSFSPTYFAAKPRSRGDEPSATRKYVGLFDKTPLTRG